MKAEDYQEDTTLRRNVLDHGFVELVDSMGDDLEPARSARISYGQDARGWDEGDGKLTRYLLEHGHTSPFEMVEMKWRVKAPIFVARQWVRHRTANWNEVSGRYSELTEESHIPEVLRLQDAANKQGSGGEHPDSPDWTRLMRNHAEAGWLLYHDMIEGGVAREQAREVLGLNTYTEWIWKNDLHNTMHFWDLRADDHAQWEFQQYAYAMIEIARGVFPRLIAEWERARGRTADESTEGGHDD